MNLEVGICPKCHEYLLLKSNTPFLMCPLCEKAISNQEATGLLQQRCARPQNVDKVIADCIALEIRYGAELPYRILLKLVENFPNLESPSYLLTKMSGYDGNMVYQYLKTFAGVKSDPGNVPWAEDFLEQTLTYQNMAFADLFVSYIMNKVRSEKQAEYLQKLNALRKEYTFKAADPKSTKWLLALYIGAAIVNVALLPVFMLLSGWLSHVFWMYYVVNAAVAVTVICVEMLLLFLHNKIYGNRLNMSDTERLWMVVFMSSIVFVIGATVLGSIWKFPL